jgi:hypothetical protein
MHGLPPFSCLMEPFEEILQRFLNCIGGSFVSVILMCASCIFKYSFSRKPNFQQINETTKQLSQHLPCSVLCMGCCSVLMKSAVLCVNLKYARIGLSRYSQSYIHFCKSSRTEFIYSL